MSEHRSEKIRCAICGRAYYPRSLRKDFEGNKVCKQCEDDKPAGRRQPRGRTIKTGW